MPFNQPFAGRIEPATATWKAATASDRLAFYKEAGRLVVAKKREELRRAIGANGRRMRPRKHPRPDGADGPVLTPHDEASRTQRLMAVRAWAGGLTLFWHSGIRKGQRKAWGTILGFHAAGQVRGAPKRDVRLSKRATNQVRAEMGRWWAELDARREARRRSRAAAQPKAKAKARPAAKATRGEAAAQAAMAKKHPFLAQYFRKAKDGF